MNVEVREPRWQWLTDADNTLWDTDSLYRAAQLSLLANVESAISVEGPREGRLEFLRRVDESLAQQDHRGLKYPTSMLVSALSEVLLGHTVERAVTRASLGSLGLSREKTDEIAAEFQVSLSKRPELRTGVLAGLQELE